MRLWFIVLLGGALGTGLRFVVGEWAQIRWGALFPWGTLAVNLLGCLIAGCLLAVGEARFGSLSGMPYLLRLFLFTGLLGGLTTFSGYELETWLLLRSGSWERALVYFAGSILLGLLFLMGAFRLSRMALRLFYTHYS